MLPLTVLARRRRVLAGLIGGLLLASAPAVLAESGAHPLAGRASGPSAASGAQVGFAAGETTTQCRSTDPTFCPRNTTNYTPALWSALRNTHAALYLNIEYMADFGPP